VFRQHVRRRSGGHSAPAVTRSDQSLGAVSLLVFAVRASDADGPGWSTPRIHGGSTTGAFSSTLIMWSRRSRRSVPMTPSKTAFARGAPMGVAMLSIPTRRGTPPEVTAIDGIPIMQQVPRLVAPRRGLDDLAPDPSSGRVARHVDMYQLAPTMRNEHQHVQRLERQPGHCEQTSRPQVMSVIVQEGPPGLTRRAPRSTPAVAPNRPVAHDAAQLEELASDSFGAPEWVLSGHGRDQLLHFRAELRPATAGTGLPAPE
jgi:hypothetical protein